MDRSNGRNLTPDWLFTRLPCRSYVRPMSLNDKARRLRALHDDLLVLPNAWDAASAAIIADAGAAAIATGSAGVSWSLGATDGHGLTREEMVAAVARVVAAVELPVTADVEAGYGPAPEDVAATVREVIRAGAVGINLEDALPGGPGLIALEDQLARIRAAREAAEAADVPDFFINARTDVFLRQIGEPEGRLEETLTRGRAFAEAGASGLFVPGLLDLAKLSELTAAWPLPVNALAAPTGPSVKELAGAGVRRVSLGAGVMLAAYAAARTVAAEVLSSGTYDTFPDLGAARSVLGRHR